MTTNNRLVSLYRNDKRWVSWEERSGKKLPINPRTGKLAMSDKAETWGTYKEATTRGNVGIMLGRVDMLGGYYLCGIDLDGCLNGRVLRPEAREIVERFKRYTEVSPSGRGVHIIFAANAKTIERVRETFGFEHRKTFSVGNHQEIALDVSNRYYTVTEDTFNNYDLLDQVKLGDLEWFLRDAGPAFEARYNKNGHARAVKDNSRSGHAFRFFLAKYKEGVDEEEAIRQLKTRQDDGGKWAREVDKRQLQRAWSNAMKFSDSKELEANGGVDAGYLTSELASEIEVKPIRWMWPFYFAKGKLFMIVGEPDRGKSTVALDLAARISKGAMWPDKSGRAPKGDVLMFNAEDDKSDTTVPRLMAAGADLKHIRIMRMSDDRMFSLSKNLKMLETHITKSTRMVVIDPVMAYLGAGVDSFKGSDVRGILSPLVMLAEKHDIVVLLLHHYNKGGSGKSSTPMHRISDSMAFGAICRHIYTCDRSPEDKGETEYGFAKIRNSNAPMRRGGGLGYDIKSVVLGEGIVSSRINWDPEPITWTPEDAMNVQKNDHLARTDATDFLKNELSKSPVASANLVEKAELRNISRRTLYRAADLLNVVKYKDNGQFYWSLSAKK